MHIAIAGNIGSGKTTLTNLLCKHYGWKPHFEAVDNNPYLDDYYKDIKRWCFNLEVFFLKHRFNDVLEIARAKETVVQDRTIYEGVHVFTAANYAMGNMEERDYTTYMELFNQMTSVVKCPDLMIYLRSSVPHLVSNIQKRGRNYEQAIQIDYLTSINQRYEDFIFNKYEGKVLVIEVDNIDYEHNPSDFASIVDKIDSQIFGLFG